MTDVSPRTALLVMDVQRSVLARFGDAAGPLVARIAQATAAARVAQLPVIFVRVAFRPGFPEVSPRNRGFGTIASSGVAYAEADDATQVDPGAGMRPGDVVVVKRRVSAFSGSDLDVVLRAAGVETLVLCGVVTSGVVLSTVRQAADLDYGLVVLEDGCADSDQQVHDVLMGSVFPRQAEVLSVAEWSAGLQRGR
jgi:nicotinamidase-related amidase